MREKVRGGKGGIKCRKIGVLNICRCPHAYKHTHTYYTPTHPPTLHTHTHTTHTWNRTCEEMVHTRPVTMPK